MVRNKSSSPINVAIPNTTELKMQAILASARAIENLSRALISTNVKVDIINNTVYGNGKTPGILIDGNQFT